MKKHKVHEVSQYQHVMNQLLTLFFSGVYITNHDMVQIGKTLQLDLPSKNREILLKTLFTTCEKTEQIPELCDALMNLLQQRMKEYQRLTITFSSLQKVSTVWMQRLQTMLRLLQQQKRGNIYG